MSRVRTPSIAHSFILYHTFDVMTIWQAFFLGIIQGVTEFLPVSSSGHLALGQHLFGLENLQDFILFDLVCHLGTLSAIFYFFLPQIKESFNTQSLLLRQVILGTLPLFPLVLIMSPIKSLFNQPQLLGPFFLISSLLLFAGAYCRFPLSFQKQAKWKECLTIGLFQAAAILPGVSRSGATISAARLFAWNREKAVQYSFLLAIPAILGGVTLEIVHALKVPIETLTTIPFFAFIVAFFTSCLVGCFSLWILIRLVVQDKWSYFAWYCLFVGMAATVYFNFFAS